MLETLEQTEIKVVGKSWVIQLPENFTTENDLAKGTQVLLTFKNENVEAEILPPLSDKLAGVADKILKKRKEDWYMGDDTEDLTEYCVNQAWKR
jgi:hypothetical protein